MKYLLKKHLRKIAFALAAIAVLTGGLAFSLVASAQTQGDRGPDTTTPIQHLVVIFQENVSFDHYFGTYPVATNPAGEPAFFCQARYPKRQWIDPSLIDKQS